MLREGRTRGRGAAWLARGYDFLAWMGLSSPGLAPDPFARSVDRSMRAIACMARVVQLA